MILDKETIIEIALWSIFRKEMSALFRFVGGGHTTFCGFLNMGVHVVMYFYYFLSAFGPSVQKYLWWKRYT